MYSVLHNDDASLIGADSTSSTEHYTSSSPPLHSYRFFKASLPQQGHMKPLLRLPTPLRQLLQTHLCPNRFHTLYTFSRLCRFCSIS